MSINNVISQRDLIYLHEQALRKSDGIYKSRGMLYSVRNKACQYVASGNNVMFVSGLFLSQVGQYETESDARRMMR
jgi:hypothetical protein